MRQRTSLARKLALLVPLLLAPCCAPEWAGAAEKRRINMLFIGNSFSRRHHLADLVRKLVEAADPSVEIKCQSIVYGGQKLAAHWEYGTQNWVRITSLTRQEQSKAVADFKAAVDSGSTDKRLRGVLRNHMRLFKQIESRPPKWDYVVLQSWRDTDAGAESPYAVYARKFGALVNAQGGRVVLYETTRKTQNAKPITNPPDPAPAVRNAKFLAQLATELNALVAPMSYVANRCHRAKPEVTLRYVNDGHPNHHMAYLTACTLCAVLTGKSPEGLPLNEVTDNKVSDRDHPDRNPDGGPQRLVFPDDMRAALQKIAWEGVQGYRKIAAEER